MAITLIAICKATVKLSFTPTHQGTTTRKRQIPTTICRRTISIQLKIPTIKRLLNTEPSKSNGTKMLIELPLCAVGTICLLFNAMTRLGCFPKRWKKSIITIIPKPGEDHTLTCSYRPISLLSCLSKLFEKCLLTRIIPYFRRHNSTPAHQFGFRERHGTIEQVNRITSEI